MARYETVDCAEVQKKSVFISTPMRGKTEEEIQRAITEAEERYLKESGARRDDICFVNNLERGKKALAFEKEQAEDWTYDDEGNLVMHRYFIEPKKMSVWYLGIALCNLADCDEAIFYPAEWMDANGCRIEREVCYRYGINHYITQEDGDVVEICYSEDWNKGA